MYHLWYAAQTHPGKVRENNEDNFYIAGCWRRDVAQTEYEVAGVAENGYLLASVCDGIGGQELGEEASLIAVETLHGCYGGADGNRLQDDPMQYVNAANDCICERMRKFGQRLGTTFTALEFADDTVFATNLGDSRIYRLRDKELLQLSTDHTILARMIRAGQLTEEEAAVHPMRHQITQYLGIFPEDMLLEPADVPPTEIQPGDRYLLCSDGLTDMLSDQEIGELLGAPGDMAEIARNLVQEALERGGRDNVTVAVIAVDGGEEPDRAQKEPEGEQKTGFFRQNLRNLVKSWRNSAGKD